MHILDKHTPIISTSECDFGDHIYIRCACGWEGTDSTDQTYEYMKHLKAVIDPDG